ncbi:MAG: hypothetical protein WCG34_01560 [Leptolinea sp.]
MNAIPVQPVSPAPKKSKKIWIIVVVVLLILCCMCSLIGGSVGYYYFQNNYEVSGDVFGNKPSPEENSEEAPAEPLKKLTPTAPKPAKATQKPLIQLPNLSGVKLGDEVRFENCGFSFKKVPDFQYNSAEMEGWGFCSSPSMIAPGGDNKDGPIIVMIDDAGENAQTKYDEMIEKYKIDDTVISQKPTKIGGVNGISVVGETKSGNTTIKTLTVFALVTPNQFFQIIAAAPSEKWGELLPYYEAVMKSVSFFEPVQSSAPDNKSKEEIRNEEGGYAFKTIADYELTINDFIPGNVFMVAKDKEIVKIGAKDGPEILLYGQIITKDISIDEYAKYANSLKIQSQKANYSKEEQVTIAGLKGKAFNYGYEIPEIGKIKARVIYVEVNPKQYFMIECYSTEAKWDKMLADFEIVTNSLTFFDAKPK